MDYDVVIVGGGPVGLTAASLLGMRGHRVAVVERHRQVYPLPRAIRIDGEVMRIFQGIGIADRIAPEMQPMEGYRWLGADGEEILYIEWDVRAPSGWANNYTFWQPAIDATLDEQARSWSNVDVLRGWAAEGLEQDDAGCRVRIGRAAEPGNGDADSDQRILRANFAIGADGANSFVRRACEIGQIDFGFEEHWLVVDVHPDDLSAWPARVGDQRCDPHRPTVVAPNGARHRRWEFMLLPGESPEDFLDQDEVWRLLEPHLARGDGELIRSAVYQFRSLVAEKTQDGRVFLIGDAAHVMPPFMGEGLCSGIRDAANLAWRLDLVLRGISSASLLADYELERKPHSEAMIDVSMQMGKVSCTIDPEAAAARDRAFRAGDVPPPPPMPPLLEGTLRSDDPVASQLTPQGTMRAHDGSSGKLDDLVGPGFVLICAAGDPNSVLDRGALEFLDSIGAAVITLDTAPSPFVDIDGSVTAFMREIGICAFLSRPDGYGFGSVSEMEQLPHLVKDLHKALGALALST
jgi:2-polyprenyl-6-methoxyphenol hydroxylase-like FAD-dependent oxidoreductase